MDEWRRSGQIPAFGDWENANEMSITRYFESARQAGLIRYSSSSGKCDQYMRNGEDLYATHFKKSSHDLGPPYKTRVRERRMSSHVKEQRKQGKVCDVTEPPRKQPTLYKKEKNGAVPLHRPPKFHARPPKPVDEDLYKIPTELLRSSKRKKMPTFFSCLVPACAS